MLSTKLQVYCLMQLTIFGWQMAAIKYEKDRAADTILPNFGEYGRFDVPAYYESYWQSPEERFYIGWCTSHQICGNENSQVLQKISEKFVIIDMVHCN